MKQLTGKWECVTQTPMGAQASTLDLTVDGSQVTGSSTNTFGTLELLDGKLEGDQFSYRLEMKVPFPMTLKGEVKVAGDTMDGQVAAGMFGKSPIKGKRAA